MLHDYFEIGPGAVSSTANKYKVPAIINSGYDVRVDKEPYTFNGSGNPTLSPEKACKGSVRIFVASKFFVGS